MKDNGAQELLLLLLLLLGVSGVDDQQVRTPSRRRRRLNAITSFSNLPAEGQVLVSQWSGSDKQRANSC